MKVVLLLIMMGRIHLKVSIDYHGTTIPLNTLFSGKGNTMDDCLFVNAFRVGTDGIVVYEVDCQHF